MLGLLLLVNFVFYFSSSSGDNDTFVVRFAGGLKAFHKEYSFLCSRPGCPLNRSITRSPSTPAPDSCKIDNAKISQILPFLFIGERLTKLFVSFFFRCTGVRTCFFILPTNITIIFKDNSVEIWLIYKFHSFSHCLMLSLSILCFKHIFNGLFILSVDNNLSVREFHLVRLIYIYLQTRQCRSLFHTLT